MKLAKGPIIKKKKNMQRHRYFSLDKIEAERKIFFFYMTSYFRSTFHDKNFFFLLSKTKKNENTRDKQLRKQKKHKKKHV